MVRQKGGSMSNQRPVDKAKAEAFVGKVLADTSATLITMLVTIGDRLGLFKDLAAHGPSTDTEFADRAGIHERYAREWLGAMTSAGYVEYDAVARRFTLPPEHALALAEENGPFFFGGLHQMIPAAVAVLGQVTEAFRKGGGVPYGAYGADWWDGAERFTNTWFENLLTQEWIPAMPTVQAQLQRGAQ